MRSRRLPSSHCCLTPRRHARASTGYRPRRHCWGRAEPRRHRVWLRSHARSARVEPSRSRDELQELQLGAWPSSPLESDLAAAAWRVGSRGENQREDMQWLEVGALEIRYIVVGPQAFCTCVLAVCWNSGCECEGCVWGHVSHADQNARWHSHVAGNSQLHILQIRVHGGTQALQDLARLAASAIDGWRFDFSIM